MATDPAERNWIARLGPVGAPTPLVIAVPHAGRFYPAEMLARARLPRHALETIEDRHADLLVSEAVAAGAVAIVARTARAYVDLNRAEDDLDAAIVADRPDGPVRRSARAAGGLGVIPSRIAAGGNVWRTPLTTAEIGARIECVHRPYHAALARALDAAFSLHGVAVLLDCHSMPSLGPREPRIVIGDRHGASAGARFTRAVVEVVAREGQRHALNHPYAGGHTLDRHGRPRRGRHALQVELDRGLYLDPVRRHPGEGLAQARRLIASIAAALIAEAAGEAVAEAAE